jgi:glycosyltransferase involved in cell wall biosynthesis
MNLLNSDTLVSIFIPAYNNPEYTRKTLLSIIQQTYRPLEVILLDDCSPVSLEPLFHEIKKLLENDSKIEFKFIRNKINLNHDNHMLGFDISKGKYVMNMPHDDWFVCDTFVEEAVEIMEKNTDCFLCAANSLIEFTDIQVIKLPDEIINPLDWNIINGGEYISMLGDWGIGCQAWSGLIFNREVAANLGTYHPPYSVSTQLSKELNILPDEFFAFQFLLSSIGNIALTEKVVSIRGNPKSSFVNSKKKQWAKSIGFTAFVIFYNLYTSNLNGKHAAIVKKEAYKRIFHYPVKKINFRILKYYNFTFSSIHTMIISFFFGIIKSIYDFRKKLAYINDLFIIVLKVIFKKEVRIFYFKKYNLWAKK